MFPQELLDKIIALLTEAETGVEVVSGMTAEELPAPSMSVALESAEGFHPQLTDVFSLLAVCKYDEHHADTTTEGVNEKFRKFVSVFSQDDLVDKLQGEEYHVFQAKIAQITSDIEGDFFSNEITLEILIERDKCP